ncbi:MAG: hypothetical protein E6R04_08205 [Spirochaetes bacterium]|nr:MAG: hypothetical protein E6R04_08205 [Spirochaetota bacterium]
MNKIDSFDHPCKETCSGWKQGYEKGQAHEKEKSKGLLQALEFYANGEGDVLDWDRVNDPSCIQDKGKTARAALREYRGEG